MIRMGASVAVVAALLLAPSPVLANREQQQLMAELRMLQQHQQQLQQMLIALADTLKVVNGRLDEQAATSRKALADQRLLIEGMTDTVRILRERADDTNVRLSSLSQELEAIRHTIASIPQSVGAAAGTGDPAGDPGADGLPPAGASAGGLPPTVSPQRTYDEAYSDYAAGQYELAIEGFENFLRLFPRHISADNAQVNIGNSHYNAGRFQEAIAAYQRVIADYPSTDSVPHAYFKLGAAYSQLKQVDRAREAWETVLKNFDASVPEYMLARQSLERLAKR